MGSLRWTREGRALLFASEATIFQISADTWTRTTVADGLPYDSRLETESVTLAAPDQLGSTLVYSVLRTLGKR